MVLQRLGVGLAHAVKGVGERANLGGRELKVRRELDRVAGVDDAW